MMKRIHFAAAVSGLTLVASAGGLPAAPPDAAAQAATAPAPVSRFVMSGSLRIHYLDWGGEGRQPLILIHGLDRTAHTFDHLAPHFASRYRVLAIDMRGHGDSSWDSESRYLVEHHTQDLHALVEQLKLRDAILWGNSTGGRVAQVYAGMFPERVARVIAEDVGPERPRQIADSYARRVAQEASGWASEDELVAQLRKTNPRMPESSIRTWVRSGTRRREDGRIVWKRDPSLAKGFVATDLWRFVSRIDDPILYVLGGASAIVPAETQEQIRKTLPRAQIVTMPGLGHYPSDEDPEAFVAIVDRFLDQP
jgi:pimeloyl-ACP methyl ester carboxylesterase